MVLLKSSRGLVGSYIFQVDWNDHGYLRIDWLQLILGKLMVLFLMDLIILHIQVAAAIVVVDFSLIVHQYCVIRFFIDYLHIYVAFNFC